MVADFYDGDKLCIANRPSDIYIYIYIYIDTSTHAKYPHSSFSFLHLSMPATCVAPYISKLIVPRMNVLLMLLVLNSVCSTVNSPGRKTICGSALCHVHYVTGGLPHCSVFLPTMALQT